MNERFMRSVGGNAGFLERVVLIRGFIGEACPKQAKLLAEAEEYKSSPWLSEADFFAESGMDRIDFLKCDIEGGEFSVLVPPSRFLDLATTVAVEIHAFAGPVDKVVGGLTGQGFRILSRDNHPDGSCVVLASRGRT